MSTQCGPQDQGHTAGTTDTAATPSGSPTPMGSRGGWAPPVTRVQGRRDPSPNPGTQPRGAPLGLWSRISYVLARGSACPSVCFMMGRGRPPPTPETPASLAARPEASIKSSEGRETGRPHVSSYSGQPLLGSGASTVAAGIPWTLENTSVWTTTQQEGSGVQVPPPLGDIVISSGSKPAPSLLGPKQDAFQWRHSAPLRELRPCQAGAGEPRPLHPDMSTWARRLRRGTTPARRSLAHKGQVGFSRPGPVGWAPQPRETQGLSGRGRSISRSCSVTDSGCWFLPRRLLAVAMETACSSWPKTPQPPPSSPTPPQP